MTTTPDKHVAKGEPAQSTAATNAPGAASRQASAAASDGHGPQLALILAMDNNHLIGNRQGMPWKVPGEMAYFKRITMGKPMIMGRVTFESIGEPLPGRTSIVVTRTPGWQHDGVKVAGSLDEAIQIGRQIAVQDDQDEVMLIGGARLARDALSRIDRFYLTHIHHEFHGDTWLEGFQWHDWHEVSRYNPPTEETGGYSLSFLTLE